MRNSSYRIFFIVFLIFSACSEPLSIYSDPTHKIQISYPKSFTVTDSSHLTPDILFRAEKTSAPSGLFTIREEQGLGILKLHGGTIAENLKEAWERRYPIRFPDFRKESYEEIALKADKAFVYEFTYLGQDQKTRVKQKFVMIVRGDQAFYLSAQAPETDFDKLRTDFDRMIASFTIL